jgi:hypothetical protein
MIPKAHMLIGIAIASTISFGKTSDNANTAKKIGASNSITALIFIASIAFGRMVNIVNIVANVPM